MIDRFCYFVFGWLDKLLARVDETLTFNFPKPKKRKKKDK